MTRTLFIILTFGVLVFSCRKSEPFEPPVLRLIQDEMKAYWQFETGTWWAYQDSLTGTIDTVHVLSDTTYIGQGVFNVNQKKAIYEYLTMLTYNTGDGYYYRYWINTLNMRITDSDYNETFCSKFTAGDSDGPRRMFPYPLEVGLTTYNSYGVASDTVTLVQKFPTYGTYANVVKVRASLNGHADLAQTFSFYASNVGLIRYEVPGDSTIKNLIDYHIEE